MIFITHILFSVLICLILKLPLDFGLILGSTIPDIDYPYSYIGQLFSPVSEAVYKRFGHRGLTHTIYWSLLLGLLAYFDTKFLTFFIGYTSHILLDLFTNQGVKLVYPYNASFVIFDGPVETGNKTDKILAVIFAVLCLIVPAVLDYLPNLTI